MLMFHFYCSLSIPQIQQEINCAVSATREALRKLPKHPSSDPQNEITNLVYGFVRDLAHHVEGIPARDGLLQRIHPAQQKFCQAVKATAPEFQPFEKRYASTKMLEKPGFLLDEEGSDNEMVEDGNDRKGSGDQSVSNPPTSFSFDAMAPKPSANQTAFSFDTAAPKPSTNQPAFSFSAAAPKPPPNQPFQFADLNFKATVHAPAKSVPQVPKTQVKLTANHIYIDEVLERALE